MHGRYNGNFRLMFTADVTHGTGAQYSLWVRVVKEPRHCRRMTLQGHALRQPKQVFSCRLILSLTVIRGQSARHAYHTSKPPSKPLRAHLRCSNEINVFSWLFRFRGLHRALRYPHACRRAFCLGKARALFLPLIC